MTEDHPPACQARRRRDGEVITCGRPLHDGHLCAPCTKHLVRRLDELPGLQDELHTTRTKRSRLGGSGVGTLGRSTEPPLPFDDRASVAYRDVVTLRLRLGTGSSKQIAERLVRLPDVAGRLADVDAAVRRGWSLVDRRPEPEFLGDCGRETWLLVDGLLTPAICHAELFATPGQQVVTCPGCEAEHDVAAQRAWLEEGMADQLISPHEVTVLSTLDYPVTSRHVERWIERGRLSPDPSGRVRVRDVLELWKTEQHDKQVQLQRRYYETPTAPRLCGCGKPVMTSAGRPSKYCGPTCRREAEAARKRETRADTPQTSSVA